MNSTNGNTLHDKVSAISVLLSFGAVLTVNALANILPINGVGTGRLSDEIPNFFVPAGVTFSVWGLIYILLAGYAAATLFKAWKNPDSAKRNRAEGFVFTLNMAFNAGWIFAWHYRHVGLSLGLMAGILATLIWLEESNAARLYTLKSAPEARKSIVEFFLTTPVNVYLGWICVATIANVTAFLVVSGWDGFGLDPRAWTAIAIAAGLAVGLTLVLRRKAVAAPLVIVWAYAGIALKRIPTDGRDTVLVWGSALAAATVLLAVTMSRLVANRKKA